MPSTVYEGLLEELASVLEVIKELDATQSSTETRRKLVHTTNTFKSDMALAQEEANNLNGGEFSIEDQRTILETLQRLGSRKKALLNHVAGEMGKAPCIPTEESAMDLDSTASTPAV